MSPCLSGSFSFPSVPPGAWLEYQVEMIGFDPVEEVRLFRDVRGLLMQAPLSWTNSNLPSALSTSKFMIVPLGQGKASRDMLFEERLEAAERRRKEGNELFQRKESADALGKYSMSLSYMDQDFMFQLQVTFLLSFRLQST